MGKILKSLGVTAALAGLAAFFLGTKQGQRLTKQAMTKTEALVDEVSDQLRELQSVSEEKYHEVIDRVAAEWQNRKEATLDEIESAKKQLHARWEEIKAGGQGLAHDHKKDDHHCDHC